MKGNFTNSTIDLSEQYILDCTSTTCSGGRTEKTMKFLKKGQAIERVHPYIAKNNKSADICDWDE